MKKYKLVFLNAAFCLLQVVVTSCTTDIQLLTNGESKEWIRCDSPYIKIIADIRDSTFEEFYKGQRETYGCAGMAFKTHFKLEGKKICKYWRYNDSTTHSIDDTLLIMSLSKNKLWLIGQYNGVPYYFSFKRDVPKDEIIRELNSSVYYDVFSRLFKKIRAEGVAEDSLIVSGVIESKRTMDKFFPLIYNFNDYDHFGKYEDQIGYRLFKDEVGKELWVWVARGPIYFDYQNDSKIRTRDGWMFIYRKDRDGDWKYKKCKKYKF